MNRKQLFEKYPYIVAWGKKMGSYAYYIEARCQEAEDDKAPRDVYYKDDKGKYHRYSEANENMKNELDDYVNGIKGGYLL